MSWSLNSNSSGNKDSLFSLPAPSNKLSILVKLLSALNSYNSVGGMVLMAVTTLVTLKVWERVKREVSVPLTTGKMLSLITTLSVVNDSVMVLSGGVAKWRGATIVRAGSTTVSEDPSSSTAGVEARMFSGAGIEAVSKRGVCFSTLLVGVGLIREGSTKLVVRLRVGKISMDLDVVLVTVMYLVLFPASSTSNVYGERMVATWDGDYKKLRMNNVITGSFIQVNVRAADILKQS